MGATRSLTVVIANERFALSGGSIGPNSTIPGRRILPQALTTRLRRYETQNEFPFYGLVLRDAPSAALLSRIPKREYEPASFMEPLAAWVSVDSPYDHSVTLWDGKEMEVHDDMEIVACTVAELAATYLPLRDEHPMCNVQLEQEAPGIYQMFQHIAAISELPATADRIVLFIWE